MGNTTERSTRFSSAISYGFDKEMGYNSFMPRGITKEYFQEAGWWTPNQIRDSFYDFTNDILNTALIEKLRKLAQEEQARRKVLPEEYIECPFCKGYHQQKSNVDGLCEIHEAQLAPFRYDKALIKVA